MDKFGSTEMEMLWLSIALGLVQLLVATVFSVGTRGFSWGIGARDDPAPPIGARGARVERAFHNFLETFIFFAAAVLMVQFLDRHSATTALGARLYFWGRLVYAPLYVLAIPFLRTLAWAVALIGIVLVMGGIWPGA